MSTLLDQASLVLIPSGYKEDIVYSQKPTDGSGDLTFTRASDGTRVNSAGLVENVPWNLLQESETFDNAIWQKSGISVTANAAENPLTGLTNADKLVADNANNFHYIYEPITYTNDQYTLFAYIKADGYSWFVIDSGLSDKYAYYNATTGVVGGTGSQSTATIESVGNGWYKAILTFTGVASSVGIYLSVRNANNGGSFTGDGVGGILIYGAQLNYGSTAKPYFPTTDRQNVPRLTYDGGCPSLLLEPQRTNDVFPSEDFSGYSGSGATISTNQAVSPDGTQNADLMYPAISGNFAGKYKNVTGTTTGVVSGFVKQAGKRYAIIGTDNNATYTCIFDLQTATVVYEATNYTGSIEALSNGWYRISAVYTSSTAAAYPFIGVADNSSGSVVVDGTNGIYIWGFQYERNVSYPTSYIPTTSAAVTRVADAAYKTGIGSLFGANSGTIYFETIYYPETNIGGGERFVYAQEDTSAGFIRLWQDLVGGNQQFRMLINDGGVQQVNASVNVSTFLSTTQPSVIKWAMAYEDNRFVTYINGVQRMIDTSGTAPTITEISLNNTFQTLMPLAQCLVFPTALTDAECIALTTL